MKTKALIRVSEMVSNVKVNTLWCGYRINNNSPKLNEFFSNLEENNQLLQIFKSSERYLSLYGTSMLYFDIDNGIIKLGVYEPSYQNETIKLEGLTEYASVGKRVITRTQSGTNISVLECRTHNETQVRPLTGASTMKYLPIQSFIIKMPKKVNELSALKTTVHNYGVLSAKQFLNKNIIDFESNEVILKDSYSVEYLESTINKALEYLEDEQQLNKTRIMGQFSNQDIQKAFRNDDVYQNLQASERAGIIDSTVVSDYYERFKSRDEDLLSSRLFVNTIGGGTSVEVMQGNLDMEKLNGGLNALVETYFNGCGLDYSLKASNSGGGVKSISEVKSQSRRTWETIKMTSTLRKSQIEEFIERMMIASGLDPKEYRTLWSFDIISNILDEDEANKEVIIQMLQAGTLSKEEAIRRSNPNMPEQDIEAMLLDIKKEGDIIKVEEAKGETNDLPK